MHRRQYVGIKREGEAHRQLMVLGQLEEPHVLPSIVPSLSKVFPGPSPMLLVYLFSYCRERELQ